uniref:glycosyltransferase family 4 protein n=1 Tax=Prevotella heparinolytica TaxID=28113 RepID=UPI0035A0437B
NNIFLSILDRWMYKQYNKIICISDKTKENLIDYLGSNKLQNDNIVTIVNGVDLSLFNIFKNIQEPYPNNKTIVTMVGAFRPQKDQKTLIDAWKFLPRETFQLWLIGDGELFQLTYAYAQKSVARNEIFFWGNREDVPHLLMSSHIVVLSSHWEGFGLAIVEGMASRKPVIASDVDGLREVTQGAGILFPQGDAKALAKAIRQLHDDPAFYRDVAERCYSRAQQFDINRMVEAYNNVYKTMVSSPKSDIV